jgi:hypothetical protein
MDVVQTPQEESGNEAAANIDDMSDLEALDQDVQAHLSQSEAEEDGKINSDLLVEAVEEDDDFGYTALEEGHDSEGEEDGDSEDSDTGDLGAEDGEFEDKAMLLGFADL